MIEIQPFQTNISAEACQLSHTEQLEGFTSDRNVNVERILIIILPFLITTIYVSSKTEIIFLPVDMSKQLCDEF
jgi:hypothetical protein